MSLAAATIVSKRHIALARVTAASFRRFHPEIPFFVLLTDPPEGCFDPAAEPFHAVRLAELGLSEERRLCFSYRELELSYALTPHWIERLLRLGHDGVVFLKQESLVTGDLGPVLRLLKRHDALLTAHLLRPAEGPAALERELEILRAGVYNGGFLALRKAPQVLRFLAWWRARMDDQCYHSAAEGMHYEQRWLDFLPAFVDTACVVSDPGMNVGHWNLAERRVAWAGVTLTVDGGACRLFRFSGYDPLRPEWATRYVERHRVAELGAAAEVFRQYREAVLEAGHEQAQGWPYGYALFDNGERIPDAARKLYRESGAQAGHFGDPFHTTAQGSFYEWLNGPSEPGGTLSRFWRAVYEQRPDVRRAFPDPLGRSRGPFLRWVLSSGVREAGAGPGLVARAAHGLRYLPLRLATRLWGWLR